VVFTPGTAADLDAHVLGFQLDIDLLGLRQHGDGGGAGVDAALGLGGGHALHAVHAAFVFEDAVNLVAADFDSGLLHAADIGGADFERFDLPPARLSKTSVHAHQIAREQAGLVSACARAELHQHVTPFERIRRENRLLNLLFELHESGLQHRDLSLRHLGEIFVVRGLGHLAVFDQFGLRFLESCPAFHELVERAVFAQQFAGLLRVVVEIRAANDVLEVGKAGSFGLDDGGVVHELRA
jgi:hypothetical protein